MKKAKALLLGVSTCVVIATGTSAGWWAGSRQNTTGEATLASLEAFRQALREQTDHLGALNERLEAIDRRQAEEDSEGLHPLGGQTQRLDTIEAEMREQAEGLRRLAAVIAQRTEAQAAATEKLEAAFVGRAEKKLMPMLEFKALYPDFSLAEITALSEAEIVTAPFQEEPVRSDPARSSIFSNPPPKPQNLVPVYVAGQGRTLKVSSDIAPPTISVMPALRPQVSVNRAFDAEGREAFYYFKFDTDPSFTSPNLWRYPALINVDAVPDRRSRQGALFNVLQSPQRDVTGREAQITFPFRASAMRLPQWHELSFGEMEKQARALGYGLRSSDMLQEVFSYVVHTYPWASDESNMTAFDIFTRGLGECGHINDLAGTFLEMNGLRYRGVAGFNPLVRQAKPGGGHSAIEVYDPDAMTWSYFDPYLGILVPGMSAQKIAYSRDLKDIPIYELYGALPQIDERVTLRDLFRYRIYYDKRARLPMANMPTLFGRETSYGLDWALREAPQFSADQLFPEGGVRIHVRARYIFSDVAPKHYAKPLGQPAHIVASPWSVTSFVAPTPREDRAEAGAPENGSASPDY